jgi:hypothetical protein
MEAFLHPPGNRSSAGISEEFVGVDAKGNSASGKSGIIYRLF